ncbi:hypothetical protein ACFQS7_30055 [Dankookia sp. GCM10030260]
MTVFVLALLLVVAIYNTPSLSSRTRSGLLLLALTAGILAALNRQGMM